VRTRALRGQGPCVTLRISRGSPQNCTIVSKGRFPRRWFCCLWDSATRGAPRIVKILELAFLLEVIPLVSPCTAACLPPCIHGYSTGIETEKVLGERAWTGNTC